MNTAAARDLYTIITTWPMLDDALTTQAGASWPPAGSIVQHMVNTGLDDVPQRGARDGSGSGEAPAPCRVDILDTQQQVRELLLDCADAIAEVVQLAPMRAAAATVHPAVRVIHDATAEMERADPRRWRWTGTRPDARYTALWLYGRVTGSPGPFQPLSDRHRLFIATTAGEALHQMERALQLTRVSRPVTAFPCSCGGVIHIHGGDGELPHLICADCGRYYSGQLARVIA